MNSTLAPIACVVTATTWDRTENRGAIARQQKNAGRKPITNPIEPIVTQQTSLTGHISNDCPRIHDERTEIVGLDVPLDSPDAGLPCDYCAMPNMHLVRDPAEVDAPTPPRGTGTGRRSTVVDGPTPKQEAFLRRLLAEKQPQADADAVLDGMTKTMASTMIDVLLKATTPDTSTPPTHRSNRFASICRTCGGEVEAGAGRIERRGDGWLTFHLDGECATTSTPTTPLPDVPEGYYALDGTGDNETVFYAVDRPTDGQWAGRIFVKLVVGGHRDQRVDRRAVPNIFARIIEAGVAESQARYGREIGRCGVCNRTLTDDESRRLGIGPVCRKGGRD